MKHVLIAAGVAMLTLAPIACNTSSSGGLPGTRESFTVEGPKMTTDVKQGERDTVKLSVNRGADFKQDVRLEAEAPKGLRVDPSSRTIKASEPADVTMTIEADKDAQLGEHVIRVKATPEKGTATTLDVKVKVEAKK